LVKKRLLNDRQRKEVGAYLRDRPWVMPSYVRGLRMNAKNLDFEQLTSDLAMLKALAELDIKTGRKSNEFKELHAEMQIRQPASVDAKAEFEVKQK